MIARIYINNDIKGEGRGQRPFLAEHFFLLLQRTALEGAKNLKNGMQSHKGRYKNAMEIEFQNGAEVFDPQHPRHGVQKNHMCSTNMKSTTNHIFLPRYTPAAL